MNNAILICRRQRDAPEESLAPIFVASEQGLDTSA